jgi:hypothetical protein
MVDTHNSARGPLLLTSGGEDRTVPPAVVKQTRKLYDKFRLAAQPLVIAPSIEAATVTKR